LLLPDPFQGTAWLIDLVPYLAAITCGVYAIVVSLFRMGLTRLRNGESKHRYRVTVVIPAHNETDHVDACLSALAEQSYPEALTEIILVDDHSTDGTGERANTWKSRLPHLRIIRSEVNTYVCPKKNALTQGIRSSSGEIILTTDADCRPAPGWIASMVSCFTPEMGMVAGFAPLHSRAGLLGSLLAFQSLCVNALSAGSIGAGFPLSCSGRNLAYRRAAFDEVDGFDNSGDIQGGDDVLLMRSIHTDTRWRIGFNPDSEARVISAPHLNSLYRRQLRYQSKSPHFGIPVLILLITVYIFHTALAALMFLALNQLKFQELSATLVAAKLLADGALIWAAASSLKARNLLVWFPLAEILSIPYVILFGGLGAVIPSRWR